MTGRCSRPGCPYLIELKERLDLPAGLRGKANPKSSTGRIDVFTRVITDHSDRFDEIAAGYHGPALPRGGAALLRRPGPRGPDPQPAAAVGRPTLAERRRDPRGPRATSRCSSETACRCRVEDLVLSDGLFLGLDLHGDGHGRVGYSTRDNAPLLDLTAGREVRPGAVLGPGLPARRATASSSRPSASICSCRTRRSASRPTWRPR